MKVKNAEQHYDVIIVGGGHAGTEAALASARTKARTLLITHNIETLGQMSCNPAIGGIGKGHLVKEIDALGGIMALAADNAGIQFRLLNASKGPAVQATRAQADRNLYKQFIRYTLENQPNLTIFQQAVDDFMLEGDKITGVITQMGLSFHARAVVLTAGTFLAGKIHIGLSHYQAGRAGDPPALRLSEKLRELPLGIGRLKTGTPPRLDGRSIDYSKLTAQPGDTPTPVFSFLGDRNLHPRQVCCYITHTNPTTHAIIQAGLADSPLYSGAIESTGPRYCPSIEDKVVRFADKLSHQVFLEPEGLFTHEVYPNGISTSLPFDVQCRLIHSMAGLEQAHITRPGYAIEYDFFDPRNLKPSLETRAISGLFFAGQINGTTGYEEAAAQGLIAGLNAARFTQEKEAWTPRRDEAYIGVLIDDLITRGAPEPYRMFTSRAEYRLTLREDNADLRLTEKGLALGLVNNTRYENFSKKQESLIREQQRLKEIIIRPGTKASEFAEKLWHKPLLREYRALDLLTRPEVTYDALMLLPDIGPGVTDTAVAAQAEIQAKYAGYIERQRAEIKKQRHYEEMRLPYDVNYDHIPSLSTEVRELLKKHTPATIGIASRLPGMTPAAISLLLIYLKKNREISRAF